MRLSHVIDAVTTKPWAITPEHFRIMLGVLNRKLGKTVFEVGESEAFKLKDAEREGLWGPLPSMEIVNGVAYIPIDGILARGVSVIEKTLCGMTDYGDICDDVDEALNDNNVQAILYRIDSPGGSVNGLYECFECMLEATKSKPSVAYTQGQMCSAAYYLGCACTAIVGSPSSYIGSIGSLIQAVDSSKAYEMAGYKVHTIRSDTYKAVGADGDEITSEQITYLQEIVDEAARRFKDTVIYQRGLTNEDSLDGRVFSADSALELGLIDAIKSDEQGALELIM